VVFVADQRGLRATRMTSRERRWSWIDTVILPLVFLGSIPLAYFLSPQVAEQSWISLVVIMPVVGRMEEAGRVKAPAAAQASVDQEAE
jgi:hypothetical protein